MTPLDPLLASLLDLLRELDAARVPLAVGGGFGLYLKRTHLRRTGERTLFEALPEVRATNDIDLFLRAEVLADLSRTRDVADAIKRLGYTVIEEAKFLQWRRRVVVAGATQEVKLDVLVGPLGAYRKKMKVSLPRARPKGDIEFHAYAVEEALHVEDGQLAIPLEGLTSTGERYSGTVYVPDAFPYLMMKLHAFSDRKGDADKDLGRHHALDVYTVVGMMTEAELKRAVAFGAADREDGHVRRAARIVGEDFSGATALGVLRLREHPLARPDFALGEFVDVLRDIFPA